MLRVAVIVALLAGAGAIYWLTRPEPIAVTVAEVSTGPVATTVANTRVGTLKACNRALLSPAAAGVVARLPVTEGDTVRGGDLLLEIWNEDLKAEVQLAEAQVTAAAARTDEACTAAAGARREARRLDKLRKNSLVSEEQVDLANTEADGKQAGCNAAVSAHRVEQT
ncbi:MAG: biotin/lipoyl-binding protein, partial [Gammaproteobacteria bacterium]|nr:biotin/lipoyl-binding protein [Gammaproteobacteria bacterium]